MFLVIRSVTFEQFFFENPHHKKAQVNKSILPNIKIIGDAFLSGLISTPDVISTSLIGHQLPVRLYNNRVEIFDSILLFSGKVHC